MPKTQLPSPSAYFPDSCPLLDSDRAGDRWISCCSKHFQPLAGCILGERSLAEDALQIAWCKVWESLPSFRGGRTACHWVRAIVANSAKDVRRRCIRSREVALAEAEKEDPAPDPETRARDQQRLRALREIVACLPKPYRQVIELRFEQELSTSETAERLGISRSNVATRLNRGLRMLKDRFEARNRKRSP